MRSVTRGFLTDEQNEKSIEDQEALNRLFAQKNEYELVKFYSDAAQSGASILGREGLLELSAERQEWESSTP